MRFWAEFGKGLSRMKFLCSAVVMMVGKRSADKIGDSRIILVIVQPDVAIWRDCHPSEGKLRLSS